MDVRTTILRSNAVFLVLASLAGLAADFLGAFGSVGPFAATLGENPHLAIGQVEAHGLALIIGIVMWLTPPTRAAHLVTACVHMLLGTANIMFWQSFIANDILFAGYLTTALHVLFAVLEFLAARKRKVNHE